MGSLNMFIKQPILKLMKTGIKDALTFGVALAAFLAMFFLKASPIIVILVSAVIGVIAKRILDKFAHKKEAK